MVLRTFNFSKEVNELFERKYEEAKATRNKLNYSVFADEILSLGLDIHDKIEEE